MGRFHAAISLAATILVGAAAAPASAQQRAVVTGVVFDSLRTMQPVEGAEVALLGSGRTAKTDDDGRFTFRDVASGSYSLSYAAAWLDSVGLPAIHRAVQVVEGERDDVRLIVPSLPTVQTAICGAPLAEGQGIVLGEVRDVDGRPEPGATVRILWEETLLGEGMLSQTEESLGTITSASGWYVVCGVPMRGDRTIRVTPSARDDTLTLLADLNTPIRRRDVMVGSSGSFATVSGRIVSEDGRALADASVSFPGRSGVSARTSETGEFSLTVPRQSSQLMVRAVGFVPFQIDVEPIAGRVAVGDVRLEQLPPLLATLLVTGRAVSREELEYEQRKRIGMGYFVDEATLERAPVITPAFVVAQVAIARTEPGGFNKRKIVLWRGAGPCDPRFFIDGWDYGRMDVLDQEMYLRFAKRVEVYRAAFAPPEFNDFGGCGSVVVWTR